MTTKKKYCIQLRPGNRVCSFQSYLESQGLQSATFKINGTCEKATKYVVVGEKTAIQSIQTQNVHHHICKHSDTKHTPSQFKAFRHKT